MKPSRLIGVDLLEPRRLFAGISLEIDNLATRVAVSATLNGVPLVPDSSQTFETTFRGTVSASLTSRGIKLQGSDIEFVTVDQGNGAGYPFQFPGNGPRLEVVGPSIVLTTHRVSVAASKFSAARVAVDFDDGDISYDGNVVDDLDNYTSRFEYAVSRFRQSDSSVQLSVPMNFTATTSFTHNSVPNTLVVTFSGKLVASAAFAQGASLSPLAQAPAADAPTRSRDHRVAGDLSELL